jgi:uncharacterized membrane protein
MKKFLSYVCVILLFAIAVAGYFFLGNSKYMALSLAGAIVSCIPFFIRFEKSGATEREIVMIAVMIALSVCSRFIFAALPHFKPVTAVVIITGMYFGADAGFVTGALTAVISNFYYGQGPWTPFQMAVWGLIGFTAGVINSKKLLKNRAVLIVFSALSGVVFSLLMDIWTTLSVEKAFSLSRYIVYVSTSLPIMAQYVVSNVIFILLLEKPIGKKLERIKTKYGMFG